MLSQITKTMSSTPTEGEVATEEKVENRRASGEDEDPLVIDEENEKSKEEAEETPAEDGEGNKDTDEDNEKEFEPTVDMLMNEFDDEATIDEEEALDQEDEGKT